MITSLYYLLGFLPSLFFGSRFLIQWLQSERQKRSVVSPLFWRLSLIGNILLALHYYFQCQFSFLFLQVMNGCIAWRNLNLRQSTPYCLKSTLRYFASILVLTFAACILAKATFGYRAKWFDVPLGLLNQDQHPISFVWHLLGIGGGILFASRFWLQWIEAERTQRSELSHSFWILSIVGSCISLVYFVRIQDVMSVFYVLFGLIPYLRNLVLLKRREVITKE